MIKLEKTRITNSFAPSEFFTPGKKLKVIGEKKCFDRKTGEIGDGLIIEFEDCALPFLIGLEHFMYLSVNDDFYESSSDKYRLIYSYYIVLNDNKITPIK
jgi:hypothetical protein